MAKRHFSKPLAKFPVHGAPGARFLRQGKYNRYEGKHGTNWLISAPLRAGVILRDSRGRVYITQTDGSIRKQASV